jgi:molybdopterin molybdotransferase
MMATHQAPQRITVLTPIAEVISRLGTIISPVAPQLVAPAALVNGVLVTDVIAPFDVPERPSALLDGWAVNADQTLDASAYSPVILDASPQWVDAGENIPKNTDAVLPPDAAGQFQNSFEIYTSVASGEGVLALRRHATKGDVLGRAGDRVTTLCVAGLHALGVQNVSLRVPRIKIIAVSAGSNVFDFVSPVIAKAVLGCGGVSEIVRQVPLDSLLDKPDADAIIVLGGTGSGENDSTVNTLARKGTLDFYGLGIAPGHTAALGRLGGCPVLALPGRLDAALSVFLVVGSKLMAGLTGSRAEEKGMAVKTTKKITSTIGMEEVIYVRRVEDGVEPVGKGIFAIPKLMYAEGWILIPADSEGVAAGAAVEMRRLP